jgi:hypothetical protein
MARHRSPQDPPSARLGSADMDRCRSSAVSAEPGWVRCPTYRARCRVDDLVAVGKCVCSPAPAPGKPDRGREPRGLPTERSPCASARTPCSRTACRHNQIRRLCPFSPSVPWRTPAMEELVCASNASLWSTCLWSTWCRRDARDGAVWAHAPSGYVEQLLGFVGDLTPRRGSPHRPRSG